MFGNEEPIGKVLNFSNRFDLVVTGLIKKFTDNSVIEFDFIGHLDNMKVIWNEPELLTDWSSRGLHTYILLKDNTDINEFNGKIENASNNYVRNPNQKFFLQPLTGIYLRGLNGGGPIVYVYILSIIA